MSRIEAAHSGHGPVTDQVREETEIAKFWANRRGEAIIVKLVVFNGRQFVDVRRYYTDKQGKFAPTAKGVMLAVRKLSDLARAIAKAETEARNRELLDDNSEAGE